MLFNVICQAHFTRRTLIYPTSTTMTAALPGSEFVFEHFQVEMHKSCNWNAPAPQRASVFSRESVPASPALTRRLRVPILVYKFTDSQSISTWKFQVFLRICANFAFVERFRRIPLESAHSEIVQLLCAPANRSHRDRFREKRFHRQMENDFFI